MMWWGMLAGAMLGGVYWGLPGAVVLGFVGWLTGLIVGSIRTSKPAAAQRSAAPAQGLEARIAALEARVARLERGEQAPVPATPAVETPVEETTVQEPSAQPPAPPGAPARANPVIAWLTGGNTIARVGLVILFLGLAFLLKWAVDHAVLPPELRVGAVALVGVALLAFGWRLRQRRSGYALGLQGGGVAVLYLTTFAALRLYSLLPPALAFALLAAIAAFSAVLAVMQDALVLAAFGAGGGFLAPILASTGRGSHVVLFAYYLLLNFGIAGIALFKSWRSLNIMGFLFTFVIGTAWGLRFYAPGYFDTTEPFLVAFFLLYVAIAVAQAMRGGPAGMPYVDGILVFGVPIAAFGLQAALMRDTEYGLAFSCVAASALYLAIATILRRRESARLLFECFLALGVVFATLAIPLALDARWTSALWALEGAAVAWIGLRQRRRAATAFGLLMQLLAGGAFFIAYPGLRPGVPWIDAAFLGALLLALAGLWTSRLLGKATWHAEAPKVAPAAFAWGFVWLLFAAHHDIATYVEPADRLAAWVALYAVIAAAFLALSRRIAWTEAAWPSLGLMPALAFLAWATFMLEAHPFAGWGGAAWASAAAAHFWSVRRHDDAAPATYVRLEHVATLLVFMAVMAVDLHYRAVHETAAHTAWSVAAVLVPPALVVLAFSSRAMDSRWPVSAQPRSYRLHAPLVLAPGMALWILYANATHDGASDPLPYLPIVNALDLGHILIAITVASAVLAARRSAIALPGELRRSAPAWIGALAFIWLNGVLLRTLHHWADIPYRMQPMMRSMLVQASLSISWSLIALALMLFAARSALRGVWIAGAALMGVVVAKLFVVELSHVGAVERIVSFIVVGLLMLAVGYMAPVPPRATELKT